MDSGTHTAERPAREKPAATPAVVPVSAEQLAGLLGERHTQPAERGPSFWVPVTILAIVGVFAALTGSFMAGRSTRMSGDAVATKVSKTHASDVRAARAHERAALSSQKSALTAEAGRELKRSNKLSYKKGRREGEAAGYSSGQSAGFSSGKS